MTMEQDNKHIKALKPARELRRASEGEARSRSVHTLLWGLSLVAVALVGASITANVLLRFVSPAVAFAIGVLVHFLMGLSLHFLKLGKEQRDLQDTVVGVLGLIVGLVSLCCLFVGRANLLMDEGRPSLIAWSISAFLFLLEAVLPAVCGYALAKSWLERNRAAEEASFYRGLEHLIRTSSPGEVASRWEDKETALVEEIRRLHQSLGDQDAVEARVERLEGRLQNVREFNPFRPYRPAGCQNAAPNNSRVPVA